MKQTRTLSGSLSTATAEFWSGVRSELPLLVGVIPFGMIYGVLALGAGLPPSAAQAMSAVVFGGSSQIVATPLFQAGAPGIVIILTIAVVNLRHALYSASVAPYLKRLSPLWKIALAYLLTDEAYAVTITHYNESSDEQVALPNQKHLFFLGAGLTLWTSWQLSTATGIFLGAMLPASLSLDFTLSLTFIAIVVPALKDRAALAAALAAGITAVAANPLPFKLGLILAAFVGILAGLWSESKQ